MIIYLHNNAKNFDRLSRICKEIVLNRSYLICHIGCQYGNQKSFHAVLIIDSCDDMTNFKMRPSPSCILEIFPHSAYFCFLPANFGLIGHTEWKGFKNLTVHGLPSECSKSIYFIRLPYTVDAENLHSNPAQLFQNFPVSRWDGCIVLGVSVMDSRLRAFGHRPGHVVHTHVPVTKQCNLVQAGDDLLLERLCLASYGPGPLNGR